MGEIDFELYKSILGNNSGNLVINENFIEYEKKGLFKSSFDSISINEITGIRFGIKWIVFEIVIGREYQIFIKGTDNKQIKIKFGSYFGYNIAKLHETYTNIVDTLNELYVNNKIGFYLEKINNNQSFTIDDIEFTDAGIMSIFNTNLVNKKTFIPWEKLRTNNYNTYFAIYHIDSPATLNKAFYYHSEWNVVLIYRIARNVLQQKKIEIYQ